LPVRQQTLRNTIQWSYDLLDAQEQRLFRCLSVFVGGWTLETAEAVVNPGQDANALSVLDGVASLLDKSLVLAIEQDDEEQEDRRLIMLETISLCLLARIAAMQHDYASARTLYQESLTRAKVMGDRELIASGLEGLAMVVSAQESGATATRDALWATKLWGAAESLREAIGAPLPPLERATYECAVTSMRTQLDKETFAAAWAEGRTMTPEQVLAAQG